MKIHKAARPMSNSMIKIRRHRAPPDSVDAGSLSWVESPSPDKIAERAAWSVASLTGFAEAFLEDLALVLDLDGLLGGAVPNLAWRAASSISAAQ